METWNNSAFERDGRYFDGDDSFLEGSYLRKCLKKPRFRLDYEKGEVIISAGDPADHCFFLDSGNVILYEEHGGKRRILDSLTAGTFLLCEHILYDHPCSYSLEAREKTVLYTIAVSKVRLLIQTDPKFLRAVFAQQTRNVLLCEDLLRKSITHNAGWLVSDFLITMAFRSGKQSNGIIYLGERLTQQQIADMLYINRITCYRELHNLEDQGLIDMQSTCIGIRDMAGLVAFRERCEASE